MPTTPARKAPWIAPRLCAGLLAFACMLALLGGVLPRALANPAGSIDGFVQAVADAVAETGAEIPHDNPARSFLTGSKAYLPDSGELYLERAFDYDDAGNLTQADTWTYAADGTVVHALYAYERDEAGLPVHMTVTTSMTSKDGALPDHGDVQAVPLQNSLENGRLVQTSGTTGQGYTIHTWYTYYRDGTIRTVTTHVEDARTGATTRSSYSPDGLPVLTRTTIEDVRPESDTVEPIYEGEVAYAWEYDEAGVPVGLINDGAAFTVDTDENGLVAAIRAENGTVVAQYEYALVEHPGAFAAGQPFALL